MAGRAAGPVAGGAVAAVFVWAAEPFEHGELRIAAAVRVEQGGQFGGGGFALRQHDRLSAAAHRGVRLRGDKTDHLGVVDVPAHPRARQCHRGHVRQHPYLLGAVQADERAADAVQEWVAAGHHVDVVVHGQRFQGGQHR